MKAVPPENRQLAGKGRSIQRYARAAGLLFLLSLVAGGFGEAYVPWKLIVSGDAAATAQNIKTFAFLFRLGFAGFLVESVCDTALSLILYVLLRRVSHGLALLTAFFGLIGTALFAVAELFYFAASLILEGAGYLKTFSPDQLNSLALLALKLFSYGGALFTVYYGLAWVVRGYLIFRSNYLPKVLGVLLIIGGLGFVASNLALVLAPAYRSGSLLLLMVPGGLALTGWLLVRGVDVPRWEERATAGDATA